MLTVIFIPINWHTPYVSETKIETTLYQTFHAFFWSLSIAWIIFACCHNYGGFINHFLSHPFWLPLSRLSFCMYLVHLQMQHIMIASRKTSGYLNDFTILNAFCGDVGFAFLIGLVWSLMFECPFNILTKRYLRASSKNNVKNTSIENVIVK